MPTKSWYVKRPSAERLMWPRRPTNENGAPWRPASMESQTDDYLANVMPVMQRLVTVIAVLAENTSTLTLSIFGMSAAA